MMFRDRTDAGRRLGSVLAGREYINPVVLGLPRGGVVVAAEVARALRAPLDVLVVRKIGAPRQPEFAIGAVTDGGEPVIVLQPDAVALTGVTDAEAAQLAQQQLALVRERERRYRAGRPVEPIVGRTVIVVDDGIATGATFLAAVECLKARRPGRVVVAAPVASAEAARLLESRADEVVILDLPPRFQAVGQFYSDFGEVTDEDVLAILAGHDVAHPGN